MRVGIIGSGHIAKLHGPVILTIPNTKLVGVCDKDVSRAEDTAKELNISNFYQDPMDLIREQKPNVVHVLTPPQDHARLSLMAMEHRCHVLVEKPIALNVAEAQKMIDTAKNNGVKLCVNHNLVFENIIQKTIELVSKGTVGEVVSVDTSFVFDARRYPAILEDGAEHCHWSYKLNGGPLQDLFPHPASLLLEFIRDVKQIKFSSNNLGILPSGYPDELKVLTASDNVLGYLSMSLNSRPDTTCLTIKGTKGTIHADLFNNTVVCHKSSSLPRAVARGLSGFEHAFQTLKGTLQNISRFVTGRIDKSGGIAPLISRFYEAINDEGQIPISLNKSLRVVQLMDQIWPTPLSDSPQKMKSAFISKDKSVDSTALVTGASGFIGTHLVKKLLSENIRVRALVRPNSIRAGRLKKLDVEIIEGDLRDPKVLYKAASGVNTIYHAGSSIGNCWEEHKRVTFQATEKLLEAALAHKVSRFIYFSTLAIYDLLNVSNGTKIREDSPYQLNPERMGPYAYFKIEAEKLVINAHRMKGLGATIVRPGIVIGPIGRVFFPHLGYRYRDKLFFLVGKGINTLPLTYVENTVEAIYKAATQDSAIGQVYNIVDHGPITVRQYLEEFIRITSPNARIISLPYLIPYTATFTYELAARLNLLRKGLTSRAQFKWKNKNVSFDTRKLQNELHYQQKFSINEGLHKTFDWYKSKYKN